MAINDDELNLGNLVHLFFECMRVPREAVWTRYTERLTANALQKRMQSFGTQSLCSVVQLEKIGDRRVYEQAMLAMYAYLQKRKMES